MWSWFQTTYSPTLRDGVTDGPVPSVFSREGEVGDDQWEDFRKRVIEHVSDVHTLTHHREWVNYDETFFSFTPPEHQSGCEVLYQNYNEEII